MGKYLDMIRKFEPSPATKALVPSPRLPALAATHEPGLLLTWRRGDGSLHGPAKVDFLSIEAAGTIWAFVTEAEGGWAAVNVNQILPIRRGKHP